MCWLKGEGLEPGSFLYLPSEQHLDHMPVQGDGAKFVLKQTQAKYPTNKGIIIHYHRCHVLHRRSVSF